MRSSGFTLLQLLAVMAIIGIISSVGYYNYTKGLNPVRDASQQIVGELNRVRVDAMANTQAQRIILEDARTLRVETATNCDKSENTPSVSNWTVLRRIVWPNLNRANSVQLQTSTPDAVPNIIVCYTSRGLANISRSFNVLDSKTNYRIDVALAGGIESNVAP